MAVNVFLVLLHCIGQEDHKINRQGIKILFTAMCDRDIFSTFDVTLKNVANTFQAADLM